MRALLRTLLVASGLALALGFAGRFHGGGDTLSVVRPLLVLIVGVLSVLAMVFRPRLPGAAGLGLALVATFSMVPPGPVSYVPDDVRRYGAYQKNLLFRLPDTRPVARDIVASGADFVTLQEMHARNRPILQTLRSDFPHQHFCPFATVGGTAVLSKWPPLQTKCDQGHGLAAMQAATPDGPLWVVSVHLHWPFPYGQPEQLKMLMPILDGLEGPVLIGGDFNMVPWSHAVRSVARATDTKVAGFVGGTFAFSYHSQGQNLAAWLPRLPIDSILVPEDGIAISLARRDRFGSDHHGLLAAFTMTDLVP